MGPLHLHLMKINAWKIAQESVSMHECQAGRFVKRQRFSIRLMNKEIGKFKSLVGSINKMK